MHTNGTSNGSHAATGGRAVEDQPAPSDTVGKVDERKITCTEHGVVMSECFALHHGEVEATKAELVTSVVMLRLPCEHLCNRPADVYAVVECKCGKSWKLEMVAGGQAWEAQELKK